LPTIYSRKKINYNPEDKANALLKKFGLYEKRNSFPIKYQAVSSNGWQSYGR